MPKITICIPCYNNENVISDTITSALLQDYKNKEVLVIDDASTDRTSEVVKTFKNVRLIVNEKNLGIGHNLVKLMNEARGRYVVYMCGDDVFTHPSVVSDIVNVFDAEPKIGVIGRYFYFFLDGKNGPIGVCRDKNILTSSCCPSGMAFRKRFVLPSNKIFIEMPYIVSQYLHEYRWTMLEYDTFAARFHPGGNTGTKTSYYTESPTQNWYDLLGTDFKDYPMFIQLKNRAPKLLWREICLVVKTSPKSLLEASFWFYALTALLVPGSLLRVISTWFRDHIARRFARIIKRP